MILNFVLISILYLKHLMQTLVVISVRIWSKRSLECFDALRVAHVP